MDKKAWPVGSLCRVFVQRGLPIVVDPRHTEFVILQEGESFVVLEITSKIGIKILTPYGTATTYSAFRGRADVVV